MTLQFSKGLVWNAGKFYLNGKPVALAELTPLGQSATYPRTATGANQLLAPVAYDRAVQITIEITTTFAAGDGAAPVFNIGETGTTNKFKATLNTGAAGTFLTFAGILSANAALLISATPATGTTSTGAIRATAIASPITIP
jgi:hypothetical protein